MKNIYFITGCSSSSGFGIHFINTVLSQGDYVAATSRSIEKLMNNVDKHLINEDNFIAIEMDVVNESSVKHAIDVTINKFKKINIIINNAGYGHLGAIGDFSDKEAREQFDINFFGALNVIRYSLPYLKMNKQNNNGISRIVNISSICGFNSSLVSFGIYSASKYALTGVSESLQDELKPFNIKVICVMPGYFNTNFLDPISLKVVNNKNENDYKPIYESITYHLDHLNHNQIGDPIKAVKSVLSNTLSDEPIFNFFVGKDAFILKSKKINQINDDVDNSLIYNNNKTDL